MTSAIASLDSSIEPSTDCSAATSWGGIRSLLDPPSRTGGSTSGAHCSTVLTGIASLSTPTVGTPTDNSASIVGGRPSGALALGGTGKVVPARARSQGPSAQVPVENGGDGVETRRPGCAPAVHTA